MKTWFYNTLKENKGLLLFIILMSVFRSAVADWNEVPTGSMQPTIVEGDRILVNKMAYDIRIPFTHASLVKRADPVRGDIVVFDSERSGKRLVKRVIGIPGDIVEMKNNVLIINGQNIAYRDIYPSGKGGDKIENLMGIKHIVRIKETNNSYLSTFKPVRVPEGHYLVLGDNRDNSADSRVIGFVPRQEIVGRSRNVVMSLDYENFYLPRSERFFHALDAD
jgi:signal peptidase I